MTDKKLTDKEIKKALECCQMNGLCEFCYLKSDKKGCQDRLHKDALDLINRLEAENERLKDFATSKCEDCAGCASWKCDCANIKAEARKEFAELLKNDWIGNLYYCEDLDITEWIDNLLKEMESEVM